MSQINVAGITSKYFLPKVGFTASLWKLSTNLEFNNSKKGNLHCILDPKFIPYFNCLSRNEKLDQHQWWKTDENAKTDFVIFLQTGRQAVSWPLFWFYTSLLMSITMTIRPWLTQLWISNTQYLLAQLAEHTPQSYFNYSDGIRTMLCCTAEQSAPVRRKWLTAQVKKALQ